MLKAIEAHVPNGQSLKTASEEFYERVFHQLDLVISQVDSTTVLRLAKYVAHPELY